MLYIAIGTFDALAMLLLILKLYRMPFWEYRYRIFTFAVFISIFSFLVRVVFDLQRFDTPLQYLLFVLFLRYAMEIKLHLSAFIAGSGITAYYVLQLGLYYLYSLLGNVHENVVSQNFGVSVYLIQASSIMLALIISICLKVFNRGFSFILEPPHDFLIPENYSLSKNKMMFAGAAASTLTISVSLIFLYNSKPLGLIIISLITFSTSYYFSKWRDYDDIRDIITKNRNQTHSGRS